MRSIEVNKIIKPQKIAFIEHKAMYTLSKVGKEAKRQKKVIKKHSASVLALSQKQQIL